VPAQPVAKQTQQLTAPWRWHIAPRPGWLAVLARAMAA